jgi:hypothetical protein
VEDEREIRIRTDSNVRLFVSQGRKHVFMHPQCLSTIDPVIFA